jgi:hypothetical protein
MRLISSSRKAISFGERIEQQAQAAAQGMGGGVRGFLERLAGLLKTSNPLLQGFLVLLLLVLAGLGGLCAASGDDDPLPGPQPKPQVIGPIVLCPGETWSRTLGPYRANVIAGPTSSNPAVATGSVTNGAGDIDVSDTITIKAHKEGTATISLTAAMWELNPMNNHNGGRFSVGHHRTGDIDILVKVPNCDPKKDAGPVPSPTFGIIGRSDDAGHANSAVDTTEPTATPTEARPSAGQSGANAGSFFDPIVELPLPTEPAMGEGTCAGSNCDDAEDDCVDNGDCGGGCVGGSCDDDGDGADEGGDCDAGDSSCGGCAHDCDGGDSKQAATPTPAPRQEPTPEQAAHDMCPPWMQESGQCDGGAGR